MNLLPKDPITMNLFTNVWISSFLSIGERVFLHVSILSHQSPARFRTCLYPVLPFPVGLIKDLSDGRPGRTHSSSWGGERTVPGGFELSGVNSDDQRVQTTLGSDTRKTRLRPSPTSFCILWFIEEVRLVTFGLSFRPFVIPSSESRGHPVQGL